MLSDSFIVGSAVDGEAELTFVKKKMPKNKNSTLTPVITEITTVFDEKRFMRKQYTVHDEEKMKCYDTRGITIRTVVPFPFVEERKMLPLHCSMTAFVMAKPKPDPLIRS